MADNTLLSPMTGGDAIADEDIAGVKYQRIKLIDPTAGSTAGIGTTANPLKAQITSTTGAWAYQAGASGTATIPAGGKVIGIAAHATTAGSFTINGGASVPIPANAGVALQPVGNLVAPSIVFTGTDSYFVEYVI